MPERRRRGTLARTGAAAALTLSIALALAIPARAHVGHVISRAERYLKIDASEADTRVVVSLMLGPDEGQRVLEAADVDGDREVTQAEADLYLAEWAEGLRDELPVTIDGEHAPLSWTDGWLDPIGRVRPVALTVEMVAHLPRGGREQQIVLEDRMVRRETFDRTDVAFRAHDGAELVACGPVAEPIGCAEPDLAIVRGGTAPSTFAAHVRYPSRAESMRAIPIALAVLLVAIASAAGLVISRRRRTP